MPGLVVHGRPGIAGRRTRSSAPTSRPTPTASTSSTRARSSVAQLSRRARPARSRCRHRLGADESDLVPARDQGRRAGRQGMVERLAPDRLERGRADRGIDRRLVEHRPARSTSRRRVVGSRVDLPDIDFPTTRYYWTVVPVVRRQLLRRHEARLRDAETPQDACAAGRVESFGKESDPVMTGENGTPFVSGLTPNGRLLASAGSSPKVFSTPLVAWQPATAATAYEVQWSRTRYPWRAQGSKLTYSTSAVLDLSPGTWYYRVRGLNQTQLRKPGDVLVGAGRDHGRAAAVQARRLSQVSEGHALAEHSHYFGACRLGPDRRPLPRPCACRRGRRDLARPLPRARPRGRDEAGPHAGHRGRPGGREAIRERLARERPARRDPRRGVRASTGDGRRRWIVDPIDGTRNYSRGDPGVGDADRARGGRRARRLGVVSAPALGRRWWAERGAGAFADGEPIHVSAVARRRGRRARRFALEQRAPGARAAVLAPARLRRLLGAHARRRGRRRRRVDAVGVAVWDLAADPGRSSRRRAAASPTAPGVARIDGGSAVSSNGLLHAALLAG